MTAPSLTATDPSKNKQLTQIIYALYALGIVTGGLTSLIAVIVNFVKRPDVAGTWLDTHFSWQLRTAGWSMIWLVIGLITAFIGVGVVVLVIAGIWSIYRIVKGWLYLNDDKPMYAVAPLTTVGTVSGN